MEKQWHKAKVALPHSERLASRLRLFHHGNQPIQKLPLRAQEFLCLVHFLIFPMCFSIPAKISETGAAFPASPFDLKCTYKTTQLAENMNWSKTRWQVETRPAWAKQSS